MPTTRTELAERFLFQGPLSLWQAIIVLLVVLALFGWTLGLEGRRAGTKWTGLFWILRSVVVSLVLWMLVGPAWETTRRRITPRSIAIMADSSRSMETVDAATRDHVRWAMAGAGGAQHAVPAIDRAAAAAVVARNRYRAVLALLESAGSLNRARELIETSQIALDSAQRQLTSAATLLSRTSPWRQSLEQLERTLSVELAPEIRRFVRQLGPRSGMGDQQQTADMFALGTRLEDFASSAVALSDRLSPSLPVRAPQLSEEFLRATQASRWDKVTRVLRAAEDSWLQDLGSEVRVLRYRFDDSIQRVSNGSWSSYPEIDLSIRSARPPATDLAAAFEQVRQDANTEMVAAVILLTDGRHNAPHSPDPLTKAASSLQSLPVYPVPIGSSEMTADVFVHHVDAPPVVMEGDNVVIDVIVSTYQCKGETGVLRLMSDENVIDQKTVDITSDRSDHRLSFSTTAESLGSKSFRLDFDPLEREVNLTNNSAQLKVEVIADKIRILLSDSYPRWEFRYLLNLFDRDERVDFDRLLFHPRRYGTGRLSSRAVLPESADDWAHYHIAILGDLQPEQLGSRAQAALSEFVRRQGGTLVVIAGAEAMPHRFAGQPVASLLPVEPADSTAHEPQGYQLSLTAEGRFTNAMDLAGDPLSSHGVWEAMSRALPIHFPSNYLKPKPSGRVLINATSANRVEDSDLGFLCWHDVGRGRVIYVAAPVTYQLRLRHGDRYHHRFWGQLIRWAVARELAPGSKTVKLNMDKHRFESGEPVQVVAQLAELDGTPLKRATPKAVAFLHGESVSTIDLAADHRVAGRYTGRFDSLQPATYQIRIQGDQVSRLLSEERFDQAVEVKCVVEPVLSTELTDVRSNRPLLAQIASVTGGIVIHPTAIEEIVNLATLRPHVKEAVDTVSMWNRWSFLAIIMICLATEWLIRRRIGLT